MAGKQLYLHTTNKYIFLTKIFSKIIPRNTMLYHEDYKLFDYTLNSNELSCIKILKYNYIQTIFIRIKKKYFAAFNS